MQMEMFAGLFMFLGLLFVVAWVLGSFFLWLALKILNVPPEKTGFGFVMITALICAIVQSFIPCIGCIIAWYFIKIRHTDTWGGAIAAWFLEFLIPLAIAFGIAMLMHVAIPLL